MSIAELFERWDEVESHPKGATIISEDDEVEALYVVLSGEVEYSLKGKKLGTESTGGIIGEMAFINSSTGNPTVTALEAVKLARLSLDEFNHLMAENQRFSQLAMSAMANRLRAVNSLISAQLDARDSE